MVGEGDPPRLHEEPVVPERREITILTPVCDEAQNIEPFCARLVEVMADVGVAWEALLVDDGRPDDSARRIREICAQDGRFGLLRLSRSGGRAAALAAGFDHARGDIVVTLDAGLQHDPGDIPRLLEVHRQGFDVVSGCRQRQNAPWWSRVAPSRAADWLIARVTGVPLHDFGCGLALYRRDLLQNLVLSPEMHRLMPAMLIPPETRVAEVPIENLPQCAGSSKRGPGRTGEVLLDLAMLHALRASRAGKPPFFGRFGSALLIAGVTGAMTLALWPTSGGSWDARWPWLSVAVALAILGIQCLAVGSLVGQMINSRRAGRFGRIYEIAEFLRPGGPTGLPGQS